MVCKQPESMEELVYFTRRTLEPKGRAMAWAHKKTCPKCKEGLMGKPVDGGKIKIRAQEYVCPKCGYEESKAEHEKTLEVCVDYTCPHCDHQGVGTSPFKRKTYMGAPAYVVECESCGGKIAITKRMKETKKKKSKSMPSMDD